MLNAMLMLIKKDLRFSLHAGGVFTQMLLLGLLLIFLMGIAGSELPEASPRLVASSFWLASLLSAVLLAPTLHRAEKPALAALLALGLSPRLIWAGKTVALMLLLFAAQTIYFAAMHIFFNASILSCSPATICGMALCNLGLCAIAALLAPLGGMNEGWRVGGLPGRAGMAGLILTPACLPLLLAGINLTASMYMHEAGSDLWRAILFIAATDLVFLAMGILLSSLILRESTNG